MTKHWPSDRVGKARREIRYPSLICGPCARKNGGHWPDGHLASIGPGVCGWCCKNKIVTEPRDWCYPRFEGKKGGEK